MDKSLLLSTALGDIYIERTCSGIRLWFSDGRMSGKQYFGDMWLPGSKFTAKEFLELYLCNYRIFFATDLQDLVEPRRMMDWDAGTFYFTYEAAGMSMAALWEWEGK